MQTAIPCLFMRGGTSRGPFFLESDLPQDPALRDRVLLAAMGSPDDAPDRRPRRRRSADEQGRTRVALDAARRGPRFPVRAGADQRVARRHDAQLRQHAGGRRPVRTRARAHRGARRRDDGADPDAQYRNAVRRRSADARTATSPTTATRASTACPARRRRSASASSKPPARSAGRCCRPATSSTRSTACR